MKSPSLSIPTLDWSPLPFCQPQITRWSCLISINTSLTTTLTSEIEDPDGGTAFDTTCLSTTASSNRVEVPTEKVTTGPFIPRMSKTSSKETFEEGKPNGRSVDTWDCQFLTTKIATVLLLLPCLLQDLLFNCITRWCLDRAFLSMTFPSRSCQDHRYHYRRTSWRDSTPIPWVELLLKDSSMLRVSWLLILRLPWRKRHPHWL